MAEKGVVLYKQVRRVGDGRTFIVEDARKREQPNTFAESVEQLNKAINDLCKALQPALEKLANDLAPIVAEMEAHDPKANARRRSKADLDTKRRELRRGRR